MQTLFSWRPLLPRALSHAAEEAIDAIASGLRALPSEHHDPSLSGGYAGIALFYRYLAEARSGPRNAGDAEHFLDSAIEAAASRRLNSTLYGGFPGIAWVVRHLERMDPGTGDAAEEEDEIDQALATLLGSSWHGHFDLVVGLVGLGVYALERWPRAASAHNLDRILAHLERMAERRADGIAWKTKPALLLKEDREEFPEGFYDLGVAHGVPGVVALLAKLYARGVARDRVGPLLDGAVAWLMSTRLPEGNKSVFPTKTGPRVVPTTSRAAWCYGDPGIAVALLLAGRAASKPAWEREALLLGRRTARRRGVETGVVDASLCHGAAGLGHIYNRLFHATGEEVFGETSLFWFERTLAMRRPGRGIGGYQAWSPASDKALEWSDDPGLLAGSAGIGLALLGATTPVEPSWDRCLLLDVPPGAPETVP